MSSKSAETRSKISEASVRLEDVLLRLLTESDELRDRLETEIRNREKEISEVREKLKCETKNLTDALIKEKRYLGFNLDWDLHLHKEIKYWTETDLYVCFNLKSNSNKVKLLL